MREEVFIAGLGGQGILLAGQLLTQTAIDMGLEVSWYPSYSPEVRGGEATCTVVIADERVGSPISGRPRAMLLMDARAVEKHMSRCAPDGIAVINTSLASADTQRDNLRIVPVQANDIAVAAGSERAANLVMLGAYLAMARPEWIEPTIAAIARVLPERHHKYLPMNEDALRRGAQAAQP